VQEVAIVKGLQAEVGELLITLVVECLGQSLQVEAGQAWIEQFQLHPLGDIGWQGFCVAAGHFVMGGAAGNAEEAQCFAAQGIEQQARRDIAVVGLTLDQGSRGHDQSGIDVFLGDTVVEVLQALTLNQPGIHFAEAFTGFADDGAQAAQIQGALAAIGMADPNAWVCLADVGLAALAGLCMGFTVQNVVAGNLVLAGAHQGQFHLVLDIFDMQGATGGQATPEGGGDLCGQACHGVVDTRGGGGSTAFHGEECLADGHADLVVGVWHHAAIALDHAQLAGGIDAQLVAGGQVGKGGRGAAGRLLVVSVHGVLHGQGESNGQRAACRRRTCLVR